MLRKPAWFGLLWKYSGFQSAKARSEVRAGWTEMPGMSRTLFWAPCISSPQEPKDKQEKSVRLMFIRSSHQNLWDWLSLGQQTSGRRWRSCLLKARTTHMKVYTGEDLHEVSQNQGTHYLSLKDWMQWKLSCFLDSSALSSAAEWSFQWEKPKPTL